MAGHMMSDLQYRVHVCEPVPCTTAEVAPNGEARMFQPIASTLIHGRTEAVLVDPPMTVAQAHRVADWIESSGKTLRYMYVTCFRLLDPRLLPSRIDRVLRAHGGVDTGSQSAASRAHGCSPPAQVLPARPTASSRPVSPPVTSG
jgi:hypothetical protein